LSHADYCALARLAGRRKTLIADKLRFKLPSDRFQVAFKSYSSRFERARLQPGRKTCEINGGFTAGPKRYVLYQGTALAVP
jgi:hypothetical protein